VGRPRLCLIAAALWAAGMTPAGSLSYPTKRRIPGLPGYHYRCTWQVIHQTDGVGSGPLSVELWKSTSQRRKCVSRIVLKKGAFGGDIVAVLSVDPKHPAHAFVVNNDMECEYWVIAPVHSRLCVLQAASLNAQVGVGTYKGRVMIEEPWQLWRAKDHHLLPKPLPRRMLGIDEHAMVYSYLAYDRADHRYVPSIARHRLRLKVICRYSAGRHDHPLPIAPHGRRTARLRTLHHAGSVRTARSRPGPAYTDAGRAGSRPRYRPAEERMVMSGARQRSWTGLAAHTVHASDGRKFDVRRRPK